MTYRLFTDYVERICPNYDLLYDIFGQRKNVQPSGLVESSASDIIFELIEGNPEEETYEPSTGSTSLECRSGSLNSSESEIDFTQSPSPSGSRTKLSKRKSDTSLASMLMAMQSEKLAMDEKKLAWEKEKFEKELELKVKDMEKDERLRMYELELKYKHAKN